MAAIIIHITESTVANMAGLQCKGATETDQIFCQCIENGKQRLFKFKLTISKTRLVCFICCLYICIRNTSVFYYLERLDGGEKPLFVSCQFYKMVSFFFFQEEVSRSLSSMGKGRQKGPMALQRSRSQRHAEASAVNKTFSLRLQRVNDIFPGLGFPGISSEPFSPFGSAGPGKPENLVFQRVQGVRLLLLLC